MSGMEPPNVINFRCFYGGDFDREAFANNESGYVGGSSIEGRIDVCEFAMKELNEMIESLGYNYKSVVSLYGVRGKVLQAFYDEETFEDFRIQAVTHGEIEIYVTGELNGEYDINVDGHYSEELNNVADIPIEIVDLTGYGHFVENIDSDEVEEYASEPEIVIDDADAGSSDEEFVDVQMKKKDWVSKRSIFGKEHIMKDDKQEKNNVSAEDNESIHKSKTEKDDYWGADGDEDILETILEGKLIERDSDDEGPLNFSEDEDDPEVEKGSKWPLYDPNTPFGSVQLELGQLFEDSEVLKKALIYYSCQTKRAWKYYHNDSHRLLVKCRSYSSEPSGCHWKLSARYVEESGCLQIRFFKDIHNCIPTKKNGRVTATFLAEEYQEKLLKHPKWKLKSFIQDVEDTYGIIINRWQAARAKKNALSACAKIVEKQYQCLPSYIFELKKSNEGSSVYMTLRPHISRQVPQFHMFYINFSTLRKGFLNGCRKVLGLDGAFLKGYCKGEVLSATARDANSQMYPVAWAVVESESKESWSWFLKNLIADLDMKDGNGWTLLSDQQKGLLNVISELLPKVEHRLCARHIFTNWIKIIKVGPLHKLYWKAVKAYTKREFEDAMAELKQLSQRAHSEMCARNVKKFCRCFYQKWAGTDVTCNNMAETFNSWILEAREKPIYSMLEEIRRQVVSRLMDKKEQAIKCIGNVTPRIRSKLNDFRQGTRNWEVIEANTDVYEVQHTHNSNLSYAVRLAEKKCACRYWDVNGIPCQHATAAICAKNEEPESYISFWYTKETYETTYSFCLEPVNGKDLWEKVENHQILPSDPRVKCGRPANKRKKAYGEGGRKTHRYRLPKDGKQFCSNCKESGHNYRTCPQRIMQGL